MKRVNSFGFLLIAFVVTCLVVYKSVYVPITHDETATTVFYSKFSVWDIMMFPDNWPNNHILNTLLTKFFLWVFGPEQWAVRIPSLLGLGIYIYAVKRLLNWIVGLRSHFYLAAGVLFFANPYLLDFFGVCRGYGLAVAFTTLSASFFVSGFSLLRDKYIWFAQVSALLASYANFTVLIFWAASNLLAGLYLLLKYRNDLRSLVYKMASIGLVALGYLAVIYVPITKMSGTGQFEFWTSRGFYTDTVLSFVDSWAYYSFSLYAVNANTVANWLLSFIGISNVAAVLGLHRAGWRLHKENAGHTVAVLLLLLTVGINLAQCVVMGTPNLFGRTALFLFPLVSLVLIALLSVIQKLVNRYFQVLLAAGIVTVFGYHMHFTIEPNRVREWWYDENTLQVLDYLETNRFQWRVSIKTHWLFHPSFNFYWEAGEAPWLYLHHYDKELTPGLVTDYYYVEAADAHLLEETFYKEAEFGTRVLMRRK
jgi:hypothetical protein